MGRVYTNNEPEKNLPTHEDILPNQRDKEFKALASAFCVSNKLTGNLLPHRKRYFDGTLYWEYNIFQHVQWLICTGHLKVKLDSKGVANCENPKFAACEFGKIH